MHFRFAFPLALLLDAKVVEPAEAAPTLDFAGYTWSVKTTLPERGGPGPNYFSASESNVRVDAQGRLHLRIEKRRGVWYTAEVWLDQSLGHGEYSFLLEGDVDLIDENAVLGLFTWDDAPAENHREIDIELSRWGDAGKENSQFVVQPFDTAGNLHRFPSDLNGADSRYRFDWQASQIDFLAQTGQADAPAPGAILESWSYTGADIPSPGAERAHLNLWLYQGKAPSDREAVEVIVDEFRFVP
jgi:hypothetical protein